MKKIGLATGVLVMAGSAVPSGSEGFLTSMFSAPTAEAASVTYKTTANLNLRTGTSTKHKVLVTIPKGKSVSYVSKHGSWYKVKYGSKTGYVSAKYVKKTTSIKAPASPASSGKKVEYNTTANLNLRTGSSTKNKVLLTIPKGKAVSHVSSKGSWTQVKYGSKTGWVATKYLKKKASTAPKPKPVTPSKPKPPAPKPPVTTPVKPSTPVKTKPYQTTENLNMRTGASTKNPVILTIPKGETVALSTEANGWAKVTYKGKTGFVSKTYLTEVKTSDNSTVVTSYPITLEEMADKQFSLKAQTDKYRNAPAFVAKELIQVEDDTAKTVANSNVRSEMNATSHIYGLLKSGTKVEIVKEHEKFYQIEFSTWRNAKKEDILPVLDPSTVNKDSKEYFQFLDLSKPAGVKADSMNKVLAGRGILDGEGEAFIQASKEHGVNEIYLASHAMLETGHGTSQLAKGVLVTEVDGKKVEPKVVYNMYGIGAVDSAPLKGGSETAYKNGWFTPEAAIVGGAKFIGEKYVNHPTHKQNTLYKMRWNPERPGTHQYATDIGWAVKQVPSIYNLYQLLDDYTLSFDVPAYSK